MENRNEDSIRNRFKKLIRIFRKDKNVKNSKIIKAERSLLSNLLQELNLKQKLENAPTSNRKRQREHLIEVSEGLQEEESQQKEELISLNQQLKSEDYSTRQSLNNCLNVCYKAPENKPNDSLNTEKNQPKVDLNGNTISLNSNHENNYNNPDQMNGFFRNMITLQNQFIYQEMAMQQMKTMMNNYFWNAFTPK